MPRVPSVVPARCGVALVAALLLGACRPEAAPPETARPVLVVTPTQAAEGEDLSFAGEVRAREESPLSFQVGGQLVRRLVDAGARVRRGQVLAEIDPGDLRLQAQSAQAQLAAAEAEYARARTDRARYAQLVDQQLVSRSTMDAQDAAYRAAQAQLRTARAQADVAGNQAGYTRLLAPRDGVVASRQAEAGQVVAAGQTIFTFAGDEGREVLIALPESRIAAFSVGQRAWIELWNRPGVRLPGTLREIAPAADAQSRTYAARVAVDDDVRDGVELGQSARVHFELGAGDTLQLPLTAIQPGPDGGKAVWVVDPQTRTLRSVPVETGAFGAQTVPVLSGLAPDALVVAAGGHLLREGQAVAPVDRDNRPVQQDAPTPAAAR
ncbi:efflux RND transporter periplasmic adaptor subunit [Luteimonas sp. FCS-9]|uniref:efflux RND transporter periplasmic adaptor subunit n=1 Tax=Luteimonas sp. FCS-9 TaxID=1547516 RepID=UPI00063EB77B|nr:efflux RND transporter periplasmic adaptor subunit [Luteimonas sp. FCS-9]KLJ02528.1 RND transporter [Luteimonas sp. FCS-9]